VGNIEVEVKVIGMFGSASVAVGQKLALPPGASVKDALQALHDAGAIDATVLAVVTKLRPPFFLVVNDEKVGGRAMSRRLADGDVVTVMQIMAGG
jgi:sulfur carrier protein ThiS